MKEEMKPLSLGAIRTILKAARKNSVVDDPDDGTIVPDESYAELFAAAPELLEALKSVQRLHTPACICPACADANAAIAKAESRPT